MSVVCCPLESGEDDSGRRVVDSSQVTAIADQEIDCEECTDKIRVGDRYELYTIEYAVGEDEEEEDAEDEVSEVRTFRTCLSCVEIRDHFECEGWIFGQLWADLHENFIPEMKAGGPCMEGLSPAAKQRLFNTRLEWLETDEGREWHKENAAHPPQGESQ